MKHSESKKQSGGARKGAGRKKGSGKFGEDTKVIRVPESKVSVVKSWLSNQAEQELQQRQLQTAQAMAGDKLTIHVPESATRFRSPCIAIKSWPAFPARPTTISKPDSTSIAS